MMYKLELDKVAFKYLKGLACTDDGLPMFAPITGSYELRSAIKRAEAEVAWVMYTEKEPDAAHREYATKDQFYANEFFLPVK